MVERKEMTAIEKADKKVKYYKSLENKYQKRYAQAQGEAIRTNQALSVTKDKNKRKKLQAKFKKWDKIVDARYKPYSRYRKARKEAEKERQRLQKQKSDLDAIADKIRQHNAQFSIDPSSQYNEGHAAIYPSDGSQGPIFISPSDTESEDMTANITSWPVDEGAPRADYARIAGKTVTVGGIITGHDRAEANEKYKKLKSWMNNHVQLTYKGDIYYKHLMISDLQQSFSDLRDNLKVSITFTFVYWAEITTSTGKNSKKKSSKSSKRTQGHRNKKYTAITIKRGQTLWGLSKRYGTTVKWLQKVNHIKNPNKINTGQHLYVPKKKGATRSNKNKIRVR